MWWLVVLLVVFGKLPFLSLLPRWSFRQEGTRTWSFSLSAQTPTACLPANGGDQAAPQ